MSEKSLERFMPDVFVGYGGTLARADDKIIYRSDIPADIAGQIIKESLGIPEVVWIHVINESVALSNDPDPDMTHYRHSDFFMMPMEKSSGNAILALRQGFFI